MAMRRCGVSESDPVRDEILKEVGQPFGAAEPLWAPDPVNVPMIRHWVDAIADFNPIYLDEQAARAAGHPGLVAPPAMLQTWGMQRPLIEGIAERGGTAQPVTGESPITRLAAAGYTGTLATNSELEFDRYLRPGDLLSYRGVLESISEQKVTGLGRGYFVTWVTEYLDEAGAAVGRQRFRIYKFAPGTTEPRSHDARSSRPAEAGEAGPSFEGEILPDFELKLTSTVIIAGAIATRDFMPVHHDRDYARAQGAPDVFMNILTTNGYVARYVTDWAGPSATLHAISIRLGAPAVPGQVMRFSGRVTEQRSEAGRLHETVTLAATNDFGAHATGTVSLSRPA
jgi:acyl dehydratase